ncbi:hypothetical protein XENOCAPTIV_024621, partial [Xenoophorus captivus]
VLEHLVSALNIFLRSAAMNCRMRVCRLGEELLPSLLNVWADMRPSANLKEEIVEFFNLQLCVHHPKGAKTQDAGAHAEQWTRWRSLLYSLYDTLVREISHIGSRGKYVTGTRHIAVKDNLIELTADICHLVRNVASTLQSFHLCNEQVRFGFQVTIQYMYSKCFHFVCLSHSCSAMTVIPMLLTSKYPSTVPAKELVQLLSVLYQLLAEQQRGNRGPYVLRCLREVAHCQAHISQRAQVYRAELGRLWVRIWPHVLRGVSSPHTESLSLDLLASIVHGGLIDMDREFWKLFRPSACKPTQSSALCLAQAMLTCPIPKSVVSISGFDFMLTPEGTSPNLKESLIAWLLMSDQNDEMEDSCTPHPIICRDFPHNLIASILVSLTFKDTRVGLKFLLGAEGIKSFNALLPSEIRATHDESVKTASADIQLAVVPALRNKLEKSLLSMADSLLSCSPDDLSGFISSVKMKMSEEGPMSTLRSLMKLCAQCTSRKPMLNNVPKRISVAVDDEQMDDECETTKNPQASNDIDLFEDGEEAHSSTNGSHRQKEDNADASCGPGPGDLCCCAAQFVTLHTEPGEDQSHTRGDETCTGIPSTSPVWLLRGSSSEDHPDEALNRKATLLRSLSVVLCCSPVCEKQCLFALFQSYKENDVEEDLIKKMLIPHLVFLDYFEQVKSIGRCLERDWRHLLADCFPKMMVNILPYFALKGQDSQVAQQREKAHRVYNLLTDASCLGKKVKLTVKQNVKLAAGACLGELGPVDFSTIALLHGRDPFYERAASLFTSHDLQHLYIILNCMNDALTQQRYSASCSFVISLFGTRCVGNDVVHCLSALSNSCGTVCDSNFWLELNYLEVARTAQSCSAHFTALLYTEIYVDKIRANMEENFRTKSRATCKINFEENSQNFTISSLTEKSKEDTNISLQELLIEVYRSIGEPDSLYGCGGETMTSPLTRIRTYEHEAMWGKALTSYDLHSTLPEVTRLVGIVEAAWRNMQWDCERSESSFSDVTLREVCSQWRQHSQLLADSDFTVVEPILALRSVAQHTLLSKMEDPENNRYLSSVLTDHLMELCRLARKAGNTQSQRTEAFLSLARFSDAQYQSIDKYMNSSEFENKQALLEKAKEEVDLMRERKVTSNRYTIKVQRELELDETALSNLRTDRKRFLCKAVENYIQCLEQGEEHDTWVFRLASLWLENADIRAMKQAQFFTLHSEAFNPTFTLFYKLAQERSDVAREIIAVVRKKRGGMIRGIERMCDAYITLAYMDASRHKNEKKMHECVIAVRNVVCRSWASRVSQVVPFSQRSGVLEWCSGTVPIGEFLVDPNKGAHKRFRPQDWTSLACRKKMMVTSLRKLANFISSLHQFFTSRFWPIGFTFALKTIIFFKTDLLHVGNGCLSLFLGSLQDAQRQGFDKKLEAYSEVCKKFRPVFRYFCMERFLDPAVWMEKRLAYTRSVATSSIGIIVLQCWWFRRCVAFEQGKILPTPETVPFRLSRDIVDGMGITGVEGVFRRCCEKTMEVMRSSQEALLTIVEVLLYDPLFDWTMNPLKAFYLQHDEQQELNATLNSTIGEDLDNHRKSR